MKEMLRFLRDEDGQGMVEYGLIIGLISVVAIIALTAIGNSMNENFEEVNGALEGAGNGGAEGN